MPLGLEIPLIFLLFILVLLSAVFSATETAYSSVSLTKIEANLKLKKRSAILIKKHHKSFGLTLATILICNNLVNISSSTLLTFFLSSLISSSAQATIIATFVMTPIIVVFGEIIPKLLAKKYSYGYLIKVVYLMEILNFIFMPLTFPIKKLTLSAKITNTESELKTYLNIATKEGVLEKREATLAKNALDLDSTIVQEVYTNRRKVCFIDVNFSREQVKDVFKSSGHSRLPVRKHNRYIGVLLLKNFLFQEEEDFDIEKIIIQVPYISKNTIATKALEQLRFATSHLAFVTPKNDSKEVLGIITIEDILEELVGEIYDEHDKDEPVKEISLHKFLLYGSVQMADLEERFECKFDESEGLSVKQWLQSRINRTIKTDLVYIYKDSYKFKVVENKHGQETKIELVQR